MEQTVYLPDGEHRVISSDDDVLDIVQEYAGKNIRDCIDSIIREHDVDRSELDRLENDVDDLECQIDDCNGVFYDIVSLCRMFRQKYESEMPEREDLTEFVDSVFDKAYDMI